MSLVTVALDSFAESFLLRVPYVLTVDHPEGCACPGPKDLLSLSKLTQVMSDIHELSKQEEKVFESQNAV